MERSGTTLDGCRQASSTLVREQAARRRASSTETDRREVEVAENRRKSVSVPEVRGNLPANTYLHYIITLKWKPVRDFEPNSERKKGKNYYLIGRNALKNRENISFKA